MESGASRTCRLESKLIYVMATDVSLKVRVVITSIDQSLSSLQNFIFLIITAREVSATTFGAFTLTVSIITLVLGLARAAISEPFMLLNSLGTTRHRNSLRASLTTLTCLYTVLVGIVLVVCSVLVPPILRPLFLTAAIILPGLLLQDLSRWLAVTYKQPLLLLGIDGLWIAIWVLLLATLRAHTAVDSLLMWGGSASFVGFILVALRRSSFSGIRKSVTYWRDVLRRSAASLVGEYLAFTIPGQILTFLVTGLIGLAATAGLRGALALFGPVGMLQNAARIAIVPEVIRAGGGMSKRGTQLNRAAAAVQILIAGVGLIVLVSLPGRYGHELLGASWDAARVIIIPVGIGQIFAACDQYPLVRLRADGYLQQIARARYVVSAEALLTVTIGATTRSLLVTAWCLAFGSLFGWIYYTFVDHHNRRPIVGEARATSA